MHEFLIFLSSVSIVFLLGLQSLNVNGGYKVLAAVTSFGIGLCNFYILKQVPKETSGDLAAIAYLAGGPIGIVLSMKTHAWITRNVKVVEEYFRKIF
jgi:hypothetical protein